MNESAWSARIDLPLNQIRQESLQHRMRRSAAMIILLVLLTLLSTLVMGCASQAPILPEPPKQITPPALHQSPSTTSYSEQWSKLVDEWRLKLKSGKTQP